jgi:hypothetical protein
MTNEPCINWPCAKGAGHAGPCGTSRDEQPVQPSSNELLSQAWDDIDSLMEYAFDNGFHELGYDPARVISDEMERVAQELADLKAAGSSAPEPCAVWHERTSLQRRIGPDNHLDQDQAGDEGYSGVGSPRHGWSIRDRSTIRSEHRRMRTSGMGGHSHPDGVCCAQRLLHPSNHS